MTAIIKPINKTAIARAFAKAAPHYEQHAKLQKTVGHTLLNFGNLKADKVKHIFDAGAGTGYFSRYLRHQGFQVTAGDIATEMLIEAKRKGSADQYLVCDIESLPFEEKQFCASFSNLAIQWCAVLSQALDHLSRISREKVIFTTLVAGSLSELAISSQLLDGHPRSNNFLTLQSILSACNTMSLNWKVESYTLSYPSLIALFSDLKGTGANHVHYPKHQGLYSRRYLTELERIYLKQYGQLQLTYRIFYGVLNINSPLVRVNKS